MCLKYEVMNMKEAVGQDFGMGMNEQICVEMVLAHLHAVSLCLHR